MNSNLQFSDEKVQALLTASNCIPELLRYSLLKGDFKQLINEETERVCSCLWGYLNKYGDYVNWEGEVKLIMAAAKHKPVSAFGLSIEEAKLLCMSQSHLIHVEEDGIPTSLFTLDAVFVKLGCGP